ncbi:MAG: type II toxin-antitoxin system VapC family toxin [Acidobacteriota bacterium]
MVIDTSAILAILQDEEERSLFNRLLSEAERPVLSAATWVECSIVIESRYGAAGLHLLEMLVDRAGIERLAVGVDQAKEACRAYSRFGKGRHPAGLNFGDCFSYALARTRSERLLFKGNDFSLTDISPAVGLNPALSSSEVHEEGPSYG